MTSAAPSRTGRSRAVLRGRRGVPTLVTIRATEVADLENEVAAHRDEDTAFARRVRYLGLRAVYGGQYEPSTAVAAGQQIVSLADRRLRQLGGDVA